MTELASLNVVPRGRVEGDLVVAGCFEGEVPDLEGTEGELRSALERLAGRTGWKGKDEQLAQTDAGRTLAALYGLGKRKDFTFQKLTSWIGRVAEHAQVGGARRLTLLLPRHAETTAGLAAERCLRTIALAGYAFDRFQGEKAERLAELAVAPPAGEEEAWRRALDIAGPVAEAIAFARDLANTPPNEATPAWMEERARELAADRGMEVTVLDQDELRRRGMGGLLAVGSGAAVPPRLVRLAWGDTGPAIALVGKGITFDTGGISIKPAADMDEMKYDKCGACAVLGTIRAVAALGLPVRLRAYVPLAENMPSDKAYRPGDILRCYNGKTVEITNTDAEGRLILADAMAWAVEDGAEALVEFSTLTGSCVVALGHQAAGLFTPDDGLADELLAAAADSGERLWRLPLYPEFLEEMRGTHADLRNSGGRWGGASLAAAFLSQFVGRLESWAHLDIAGVANLKPEKNGTTPGATGYGIASAVSWLRKRTAARG